MVYQKLLKFFLLILLFSSCKNETDILVKKYDKKQLIEDFDLLYNIINESHAAPYDFNDEQFVKNYFDSVKSSITEDLTLAEFYKKVNYALDVVGCLHTDVNMPYAYYDSLEVKKIFFPVPVIVLENKIIVNSDFFEVPLGAEILSINNYSSDEIINSIKRFNHIDGKRELKYRYVDESSFAFDLFIACGSMPTFTVRFIKPESSEIISRTYNGHSLRKINTDLSDDTYLGFPDDAPYKFQMLDGDDAAILSVRSFGMTTWNETEYYKSFINNSFRMLSDYKIKNLVIDCRGNGGGYYEPVYNLLSYLVKNKLKEYDSAFRRFDNVPYVNYLSLDDSAQRMQVDTATAFYSLNGYYKQKDETIEYSKPAMDYSFNGKVYLVINHNVASAASQFAAVLKNQPNVYVVGEETNGSYTSHNARAFTYVLPYSKLNIFIPVEKYYQPVIQSDNVATGVIPHKIISLTKDDILNYNDRPLNFIFDSIISKK